MMRRGHAPIDGRAVLAGTWPAATTLRDILSTTRESAGAASIISMLLLVSGSNFFANLHMVFNLSLGTHGVLGHMSAVRKPESRAAGTPANLS